MRPEIPGRAIGLLVGRTLVTLGIAVLGVSAGCNGGGGGPSDPPGDANVLLDVDRLAVHPCLTHLDFDVVSTVLFYDTPPPAPARHGSCDFPEGVLASSNGSTTIGIDLTATGRVPIGGFQSPPGHVTEIRLLVNHIRVTAAGKVVPGKGRLQCERRETEVKKDGSAEHDEEEELAILRLIPSGGSNVDLVADQTIELKADLDPTRDIILEDDDEEGKSCQLIRDTNEHEEDSEEDCEHDDNEERVCGGEHGGAQLDGGTTNCKCDDEGDEGIELADTYSLEVVSSTTDGLIPGLVLVTFNPGLSEADIVDLNATVGGAIIWKTIESEQLHVFGDEADAIQRLRADSRVRAAIPETRMFPLVQPNDLQGDSWYFLQDSTNMQAVWDIPQTGSRQIIIAVIDTGLNLKNPDIVNNVWLNEGELPPAFTTRDATNRKAADFDNDGIITFHDFNPEDATQRAAAHAFLAAQNVHNLNNNFLPNGEDLFDPDDFLNSDNHIVNNVDDDRTDDPALADMNLVDDLVGWNYSTIIDNNGNPSGVPGDNRPDDIINDWHGTIVSSVLAAVGNNSIGIPGAMWQVRILPIKVLGALGEGSHGKKPINQALRYAQYRGAALANVSVGDTVVRKNTDVSACDKHVTLVQSDTQFDSYVADSNATFLGTGVTIPVVAPVTDCAFDYDSGKFYSYLSSLSMVVPNVISVTATDRFDQIAPLVGFGKTSVDIGAPGIAIWTLQGSSTTPIQRPMDRGGTSVAAPLVSGTLGLVLSQKPSLSGQASALRELIVNTGDKVVTSAGVPIATRGGRLNAFAAVRSP